MNSTVNPNRYIPSYMEKSLDYMEIGNCETFFTVTADKNGKFYAMGFSGKKRSSDFHFYFKTVEKMNEYMFNYIEDRKLMEANKKVRKANQKIADANVTVKVGDLFGYSWGYEQTQYEGYQVTQVKGRTVTLCRVQTKSVPHTQGMMCEYVTVVKDAFYNAPYGENVLVKRLKANYNGKPSFSMSYGSLQPTTESDKHYTSWYN